MGAPKQNKQNPRSGTETYYVTEGEEKSQGGRIHWES
jgi:hypothetical protein